MSDLQRDIEAIDELVLSGAYGLVNGAPEAWQRLRARLTPDREQKREALRAVVAAYLEPAKCPKLDSKLAIAVLEAAIAAMGVGNAGDV